MNLANRIMQIALRRTSYDGMRGCPPDFDPATQDVWRLVRPFTMTSPERVFALRQSVQYLFQHGIQGAVVECGVWKGGSMMAVARTLLESGVADRDLHLFDTFEGMSVPTREDVDFRGNVAADPAKEPTYVWPCNLHEVKRNLEATGYPVDHMFFIKGKVE